MQLKGSQILNAIPGTVWEMLMDPVSLAKIIPGISSLEKISENAYKSNLHIKIGPINGSFSGNLQLEDIIVEKSFTLKAQQNSKIGNANTVVDILMAPSDNNQTEVNFLGDVKLSGMLASMGQRVISGVAASLTKQFFTNLEKELAAHENNRKK